MSAIPTFPGMNPYLEGPTRWPEIHTWLIVEIEEDAEPILNLKQLLDNVCRETAIESDIDYTTQPQPPLSPEDYQWIQQLIQSQTADRL